MGAITGIFYRDGRTVPEEQIKKMNDRLSHRGPDGSAVWCDGSVALGHQMLYTTPESLHEKLPYEEDDLVITADARIDNRKELSEKLEIEDKEEISDSYFILKAYQKWGERCPEELLGDFAFAIWDKNKERLFCARDHMGVKPFYYYLDDEMFVFGTEIKALLCNDKVPRELNELMIALNLIPSYEDRVLTCYKDIIRLPAANQISVDGLKYEIKKYWELDPDLTIRMDTDEDYVNKFYDLFTEAVNCRLRSPFTVGFELSGGMDSSSVVGVAKKTFVKDKSSYIDTFSYITESPRGDESYYIKKVIDSGGIKSHFLNVDHVSPLSNLNDVFSCLDEPFSTPNMCFFWNLYEEMQNNNIKVVLSGHDGDSALSHGENYLKELALKFQWITLFREIRDISKHRKINFFLIFGNKVLFKLLPELFKKTWRWNKKSRRQGDFVLSNRELDKKLGLLEFYKPYDKSSVNPNTSREFHYRLINQGAHQYVLEVRDKVTSAFSIEPRYPFFDKRLLEFCYAIPTEQKFKFGWDRMILRQAMDGILPEEVQWRPNKKHLTSVFERNLLVFEKDLLEELISERKGVIKDYIDPDDLQDIYDRYKNRSKDYNIADAWDILKLVILLLWMEKTKIGANNKKDNGK